MEKDDKIHKKSFRKIDAIVTGMLLGGIVASIYGIKKTVEKKHENDSPDKASSGFKNILKLLVFGAGREKVEPEKTEKKRSIFSIFKK